jgi:hypothetical protein
MTTNQSGGDGHSEWFATELGDRWEPDGPGIYRFVEEPDPTVEPTDDSAGDDLLGAPEPLRAVKHADDQDEDDEHEETVRRIRFSR